MGQNFILDNIYKITSKNNDELFHIWTTQIVFSWRWWVGVILTIIPWYIWIKYRDKKDTARLLFVGLTIAIVTQFLDIIGIAHDLWHYDWKVMPYTPNYIPWDFSIFPVGIMFSLQLFPKVKPIFKGMFFALISSFVFEPLFFWLSLYHPVKWKYWYSTAIYFVLYLFFNRIYTSKLLNNGLNRGY